MEPTTPADFSIEPVAFKVKTIGELRKLAIDNKNNPKANIITPILYENDDIRSDSVSVTSSGTRVILQVQSGANIYADGCMTFRFDIGNENSEMDFQVNGSDRITAKKRFTSNSEALPAFQEMELNGLADYRADEFDASVNSFK